MALTQADLAKLNAQHEAVQKELYDIVTKRGVSAEQREIDNARINVLNKRAADIVKQQRSAQGIVDNTPSKPTPKPQDTSTAKQNLSPNETDKLTALNTKKTELQRKQAALINAQKQGQLPDPEVRKLQNQIDGIQKEQDDLVYKGSKQGDPLTNQQGTNVGEPSQIEKNSRSAEELLAAAGGREGQLPGQAVLGAVVEPATSTGSPDVIPVRSALPTINGSPLPNELHQYPSYTYGISLHLLTSDEYNQVVIDQKYTPKRVLISSAGRYDPATFPRSEFFSEDFYFDDLEIDTIIGLNATTRNTNAIKASFTIIEPYGFSLMERLIDSTNAIKSGNYLDMPYLLEIDFFAQNDAGEIVGKLSNISKRIPIKLAAMDIKASVRGSEYVVQAYAFNHSAYDITTVSGPDHIEVVAGDVIEFFGAGSTPTLEPIGTDNSTRAADEPVATAAANSAPRKTYSSYSDALNDFYLDLKKKNLSTTNDTFSFMFDPEISAGKNFSVISRNLSSHTDNQMSNKNSTSSIRISNIPRKLSSDDFNIKKKSFTIDAGTTIEKVINYTVRMSDYIQQQIATPDDYGPNPGGYTSKLAAIENNYLNWFKIVPIVKLGEWDSKKRIWQRHITYHVQTYAVKNVRLETAPQQTADSPVKKYEYLYTGKNDDIIDWDLHFNALYYNAMTAYKTAMTKLNSLGAGKDRLGEESKTNAVSSKQQTTDDPNAVMPMVTKHIVTNTQTTTGSSALTVREMAVADLEESLMTMSGADMLQVKLKIIGDPAYIKQDDVFYPPTAFEKITESGPNSDQRLTPNRSLRTDYGEVYVQLLFKHPRDIDESTGTMLLSDKKETSVFSGLYKLLRVTSNFSQGAFTQVLEMIRLPNQTAYDYTSIKPPAPPERVVDQTSTAADQPASQVQDEPAALPTPSADPNEGAKAAAAPAEAATPPVDPNQKDLANVAATAEEKPISSATAPQAVVPNPNAGKIKDLQSDLDRANSSLSQQQFNVDSQRNLISIAEQNLARAQATNNEAEITTWQNSIAERTRTLATLQNQFNDAKSKVDSINSQISALQ